MGIKLFKFPSFDEWNKNNEYKQKIGDYTCMIGIFSWSSTRINTYRIAISNSDNPLNVNSCTIMIDTIKCKPDDSILQDWYDRVILKANEEWEKYILKTYLEID